MNTWITLLSCPWFTSGTAFVIGACLGRFVNNCIEAFPRHEALGDQLRAIRHPPAHIAILRRARGLSHRLPIIGWLLPGNPLAASGRGWPSAAVELANALLLALLAWSQTPEIIERAADGTWIVSPHPFLVPDWEILAPPATLTMLLARFLLHVVLFEALLIASVIDLKLMIIPDGSTIPATLFALALSLLAGGVWLVPLWYEHTGMSSVFWGTSAEVGFGALSVPSWIASFPHVHGFLVSLVGLIIGGGIVWAVRIVGHWALGREAMGFGDVVLMALVGSVIGWQPALVVFFLAPVCACVVIVFSFLTGRAREFPYGPWLSMATIVLLLLWPWIWPRAGQIFLLGGIVPILAGVILILLGGMLRAMRWSRGGDDEALVLAEWRRYLQNMFLQEARPDRGLRIHRSDSYSRWQGIESARGESGAWAWRPPAAHPQIGEQHRPPTRQ